MAASLAMICIWRLEKHPYMRAEKRTVGKNNLLPMEQGHKLSQQNTLTAKLHGSPIHHGKHLACPSVWAGKRTAGMEAQLLREKKHNYHSKHTVCQRSWKLTTECIWHIPRSGQKREQWAWQYCRRRCRGSRGCSRQAGVCKVWACKLSSLWLCH